MNQDEQRASVIAQKLTAYQKELEETYDEDLPGLDLEALHLEHQGRVESARKQLIDTLLERRKERLDKMSDDELERDEQRAVAIQRLLDGYEAELNQMSYEELLGRDPDDLRFEDRDRVELEMEELTHSLLVRRKQQLAEMSDEDLLKDDDED